MSINDLFSATFNSLRRARSAGGRKAERTSHHHHHHHHQEEAAAEWPAVSEWTRKQVRAYFKRQLQLDEYVGALRRAKVDGARLVALHHADALYTTLGVTKIGHKKKLMVALRGLLQAAQADASSWPAVVAAADSDHHHRPCGDAGLRVRRATMAADDQHNDHHRHNPRKNENDEVVVAGAAKNERTKATTTATTVAVPPPLDWAKLQRSRSSPVDEVVSVVSSAESADSPRSQLQHSPRPATTRSAGRSPRQQLAAHPIARTGPRVHIQLRDLALPPTFGSAVVPAVSTMSHDTASTNAAAWSLPVSPAGSHVFGAIGTPSSPSSSPPPLHHHHRQSATPTCTTLAYSRAFGGVAVKCVYGDDVSMLRFHFAGACTESGDDSESDSDSEESESESDSDGDSDGDERKEEADKLHFVELRDAIRAAYGRNLRVKYSDRDGDTINIDSDASLNYAFNDWRGQIGLVDHHHHHHHHQKTTSWRLHLHDFDDDHDHHHHHHHHGHGSSSSSLSSLSSPSSSSSLFLASSTVHDTVVETPSRRKLCK